MEKGAETGAKARVKSVLYKRLVEKINFGSKSLSKASAAAVTMGRSAAVVWRPGSGQWSVLPGIGKATNQEAAAACRQGAGDLQGVPVCAGEGCSAGSR